MVSFVHTDISRIDLRILRDTKYGDKLQSRAINYLIQGLNSEELWFPAYNYDFGKNKTFNPKLDGTSVGAINTEVLKMTNSIRTYTPMYSYVGFGEILRPKIQNIYNPFNEGSEMHSLLYHDADVIFFGAELNSFTFIHYIEEFNNINYRYVKKIAGELYVDQKLYTATVELKVRPMGKYLRYDWEKIENDLVENKIIRPLNKISNKAFAVNMADTLSHITKKLKSDPYYLLDRRTKEWIIPMIADLKRPFIVEDFEEEII
jgi:aminoglycoside N3'-acetyltransferase